MAEEVGSRCGQRLLAVVALLVDGRQQYQPYSSLLGTGNDVVAIGVELFCIYVRVGVGQQLFSVFACISSVIKS